MQKHEGYRIQLNEAVLKAVMEVSIQDRIANIHTNEVLKVMLMTAALFLATDPEAATPGGRKKMAKRISDDFLRYLRGAQSAGGLTATGIPFFVTNDEEPHGNA